MTRSAPARRSRRHRPPVAALRPPLLALSILIAGLGSVGYRLPQREIRRTKPIAPWR